MHRLFDNCLDLYNALIDTDKVIFSVQYNPSIMTYLMHDFIADLNIYSCGHFVTYAQNIPVLFAEDNKVIYMHKHTFW